MDELTLHNLVLDDGSLRLRPLTEQDWDVLLKWNSDPEVLFFSEGSRVERRTLEEVHGIYRSVSHGAWMFIAEVDAQPIGECWLQHMNLDRILRARPGMNLFRIDLTIGEKDLWGKGWGTRIIRLLTDHGFQQAGADAVFGIGVADYNPRSRRAFEKNGFVIDQAIRQPPGSKATIEYDMILTREAWTARREGRQGP